MPFVSNMQEFLDELTIGSIATTKEKLITATSLLEKMKVLEADEIIMKELSDCLDTLERDKRFSKNSGRSSDLRKKGNTMVQRGETEKSLNAYSMSLSYAPPGTPEYFLALVNRSVALFLLKHYKECIEDIDLVLNDEKNIEKKLQLLKRKGKSLQKLGQSEKAKKVFQEARQLLQGNCKVNKKLTEEIESALKSIQIKEPTKHEEPPGLPELSYGPNPSFHCASSGISLKSNLEKGRHVVTNRPIKEGDTLFVEKPVAFVLLPYCKQTRCGHCLKTLRNPIPCLGCSGISYCCNKCRVDSWSEYHSLECGPGMDLCFSLGIAHLAYRLGILSMKPGPEYQLVEGLLAHTDHLSTYDLIQYCLTALLLAMYLKRVSRIQVPLEELGTDLLKHIARMISNGNAIIDLMPVPKMDGGNLYDVEEVRVATAIYPSASMMNHSCDPNIMTSFSGTHIIVKVVCDLDAGSEVFNCYGPCFRRDDFETRQKSLLAQYNFVCTCTACTSPHLKNFSLTFNAYLCPKCTGPVLKSSNEEYLCSSCLTRVDLTQEINEFHRIMDKDRGMNYSSPKEALDSVLNVLDKAKKIYYKHHVLIGELKSTAAKYYSILGEYEESFGLTLESMELTELRFGQQSIEMAMESIKLFEIANSAAVANSPRASDFSRIALKYLDLAKRVLSVQIDRSSPIYKQIEDVKIIGEFSRVSPSPQGHSSS